MTPEARDQLMHRLMREEGESRLPNGAHKVYRDSKGILTTGWGWNLEANGIPDEIAKQLLGISMKVAETAAQGVPGYLGASPERQSVIVAMCFQMGLGSVLRFTKFISAFRDGDYAKAADEMLDSTWARTDSPARAKREAEIMRSGVFPG